MFYFGAALAIVGLLTALGGGLHAYIWPWLWQGRAVEVIGVVMFVVGALVMGPGTKT